MSGPKSGHWCVVSDGNGMSFREAKSILSHYLKCIMQYKKQLDALMRHQPTLRINKWVDDITDSDYYWPEKIAQELNNRYEIYIRLRNELDKNKAETADFSAMREQAAAFITSYQRHLPSEKNTTLNSLQALYDKVNDIVNSVDPRSDTDSKDKIEALAKDCLSITDIAKAELFITDLRVRVSHLNKATIEAQQTLLKKQSDEATEAIQWLSRLGCNNSAAVKSLREDLLKVATSELSISDNMRKDVNAAIAESDRNYAGLVLKEALEEFGYEVKEGFETVFSHEGSNYFQRPSWGEYHCRVTVDPQNQRVNFNMVRYAQKDQEFMDSVVRDREMEESWCSEVPKLIDKLAKKNLKIDFTRKLPPGTFAVQLSDDIKLVPSCKKRTKEDVRYLKI